MITRRWIAVRVRRWWGELLVVSVWGALLILADVTSRVPALIAGTTAVLVVLGVVRYLDGVRAVAREIERDIAAEIALSVRIPRDLSPVEQFRLEAFQARIARAIRGQAAHLREGPHASA